MLATISRPTQPKQAATCLVLVQAHGCPAHNRCSCNACNMGCIGLSVKGYQQVPRTCLVGSVVGTPNISRDRGQWPSAFSASPLSLGVPTDDDSCGPRDPDGNKESPTVTFQFVKVVTVTGLSYSAKMMQGFTTPRQHIRRNFDEGCSGPRKRRRPIRTPAW